MNLPGCSELVVVNAHAGSDSVSVPLHCALASIVISAAPIRWVKVPVKGIERVRIEFLLVYASLTADRMRVMLGCFLWLIAL